MATLKPNWSADIDWQHDLSLWREHVDGWTEDGEEDDCDRYLGRCLNPDHFDANASFVILVARHPAPGQPRIRFLCRSQTEDCSARVILNELRRRVAAAEDESYETDPFPHNVRPLWPEGGAAGGNGNRPPPGGEQPGGEQAEDVPGEEALDKALAWWGPRCGVSPQDCRDDPHMTYTARFYKGEYWLGFIVNGALSKGDGWVIKWRRATDAPPKDENGTEHGAEHGAENGKEERKKKKDERGIWWENLLGHPPKFNPPVPKESTGATTLFVTEGEGDRTLVERAYRGVPDIFVTSLGNGATTKLTPQEIAALYDRGYRRLIIAGDGDPTGQNAAKRLAQVCQGSKKPLQPVLLDLRFVVDDPLLGVPKDIRDCRRLWTPAGEIYADPALVRAALERAIQRAAAERAEAIANFEAAYLAQITLPDCWVDDVIAEGCLTLITAKQFKGKSTWLMAYMAAARQGWTWLDHCVRKHRILFISEEGRRSLWKKREKFGDMSHVALHCADFPELESEDWNDRIVQFEEAAQRHRADVIVIDTMFHFAITDNESESAKVRPLFKKLRYLARRGYAVVVTTHNRKIGGTGGDQISGSGSIPGEVDVAFEITDDPEGNVAHRARRWIKNRLNEDLPMQPGGVFAIEETRTKRVDLDTSQVAATPEQRAQRDKQNARQEAQQEEHVLRSMPDDGTWVYRKDIAAASGIADTTLRRVLERLEQNHKIDVDRPRKFGGGDDGSGKHRYRKLLHAPQDDADNDD